MPQTDTPRIAIVGGGPIGLEAALYARRLGVLVTVYERGRIGEHLRRWGHVRLFTPFSMNVTPVGRAALREDLQTLPGDGDLLTGKEYLAAYLEPLSRSAQLRDSLRTETHVVQIGRRGFLKEEGLADSRRGRSPFRLLVRDAKQREWIEEADVVLDCTGTYGQHRWMGDGGIPAIGELPAEPQIAYGLDDVLGGRRSSYAGKTILLVGSGYSAATTVCNLASLGEEHPETWVIWLARGSSTQPIRRVPNDPLRERDRLALRANTLATRPDGNVEFHNQSVVESVESAGPEKGFQVTARCAAKLRKWDVDRIIANVGYSPDRNLYRELQVHECYASFGPMKLAAALLQHAGADCLSIPVQGPDTLRNPEPKFFVLGAKSYGRNSEFLMRTGFEQIRGVFALITGDATLNLYRQSS